MNQLKLAVRQLKRRPSVSAVVVLMLALGIGATTAMFSLGAEPKRLQAMVLKQVGAMAAAGAAIGVGAALALGSAAQAVLFGLSGREPMVFGAAFATLAAVVLAASWLPAWRASRIAPIEALRYE